MTFAFEFYAERAFLGFVKRSVDRDITPRFDVEVGAASVLACAAALEAALNRMLELKENLKKNAREPLRRKIEILSTLGGNDCDWTLPPWSNVRHLLEVRNWLAHYKESWLGLINSDSEWVPDHNGDLPDLTPGRNLRRENIQDHYNCVREVISNLAFALNLKSHFEYMDRNDFESIVQTA